MTINPVGSHTRLERDRRRLERIIGDLEHSGLEDESGAESIGEIAAGSQHQADVATETFERERDLTVLHDLRTQLNEIDAALGRLAAGVYGVCEACGSPIGTARLAAVPATRYCLHDEERQERAALFATGVAPAWMGGVSADGEFLSSDDELTDADDEWEGPESSALHTIHS